MLCLQVVNVLKKKRYADYMNISSPLSFHYKINVSGFGRKELVYRGRWEKINT